LFLRNELQISDRGIQYRVGKKLELGAPWDKIKCIRTIYPGFCDIIQINKKEHSYPYAIVFMHKKERIEAFKKMAEYAQKYDIEIDDQLGYLNK
jgi:hypothetical protein